MKKKESGGLAKTVGLMKTLKKVKTTLLLSVNRGLTLAESEFAQEEMKKKESIPLYARPINEKMTIKVKMRKAKREEFKKQLYAINHRGKQCETDELLDN